MKVSFGFDPFKKDAPDGKHQFLIRLAKDMRNKGVKVNVNRKSDIHLRLPREAVNKKAQINVLRLDGLIMNTRWNYKVKNRKIIESILKSNALVYQGKFCEMAYRKFLNITNMSFAIIPNGASPQEFGSRRPKNYFLANSKWRPHKRLKTTIKCFEKAQRMGLDSQLIVTGKPDYKVDNPKIKFVGWRNRPQLVKLLSQAIASLHLTWLDWCPNAMVEAIVARCPVIYSMSGGHKEIAKNSGIGVKDKYWSWDLIDLYDPPSLDKKEVANAMIVIKNKGVIYPPNTELDITNVCDKYLRYFKKLLK